MAHSGIIRCYFCSFYTHANYIIIFILITIFILLITIFILLNMVYYGKTWFPVVNVPCNFNTLSAMTQGNTKMSINPSVFLLNQLCP